MSRYLPVLAAMLLTLAAPFALRPKEVNFADPQAKKLIILTPHNESIRYEFSRAFARYMKRTTGEAVEIDWRSPGGTSEISRVIETSYLSAFKNYWKTSLGREWTGEISQAFDNSRLTLDDSPGDDTPAEQARRAFLESDVGIRVDLFFGGGAYDFQKQASAGHLVDCGVVERHPDWFTDAVIPQEVSGETLYDPEHRWFGCCLSAFGIVSNQISLERLGIEGPLTSWEDLGDPRLARQVALADPTKSGSVTKAFEMLIQQKIHEAVLRSGAAPDDSAAMEKAVAQGWIDALRLIQRICANARYFTDYSPKIPLDVAQGNAAAGMSIDFYGRTFNERVRREDGSSRVDYYTPEGGSSIGADPIGMLRGAPNPELAQAFIDFVLSPEGQKIWNYRKGEKGGPARSALRRMPIRKDFYVEKNLAHASDPEVLPYELAKRFEYHPEWTARIFGNIRFAISVVFQEPHEELSAAWETIVDAGLPESAVTRLEDFSPVTYEKINGPINEVLRRGDRLEVLELSRELREHFRAQYREAERLALDSRRNEG